jgi:hypothetical protein
MASTGSPASIGHNVLSARRRAMRTRVA